MDERPIPPTVNPQVNSIKDRIARAYYTHGLFCSSHPYSVIVCTLIILAICCYPLLRLPILGSSSQHFTVPFKLYDRFHQNSSETNKEANHDYEFATPRWFQGSPVAYVQQIVVKIAVSPWRQDLILTDAFRAPLAEAFKIRELIDNHQVHHKSNSSVTLTDLCYHTSEAIDKPASSFLPNYLCLVVSPTNVWKQSAETFQNDAEVTKTVFSLRDSTADSSSLREILFGVPWKECGMKQFNVRTRPRVLTYAITMVFQKFDSEFLHSIQVLLKSKYGSEPYSENITYHSEDSDIAHVYFQDLHACAEFIPLGVAYTILFLYIYFSVRKIELVRSKWALAISAVMTVMMSLFMSVGLCVWFGLNPTLNSSEILPYLIVVIGLENMLVLTKSVVSTPVYLDVKLRVAQGLSKEGWSITKNLFAELALLTVAFLTFVPKIQEFCLFAVVGLLTDFFLQLVFFATFLSIDIRHMEFSDLHKNNHRRNLANVERVQYTRRNNSSLNDHRSFRQPLMSPSASVASIKSTSGSSDTSAKVFAHSSSNPVLGEPSKRMKFIYFWARTRIVQRGLMLCLGLWICLWAYNSSIFEKISENTLGFSIISDFVGVPNTLSNDTLTKGATNHTDYSNNELLTKNIWSRLKHQNLFLWKSLSSQHWPTLFGYYNVSLSGRYISILPPFHLSIAISPEVAAGLRTPADIQTSEEKIEKYVDDHFSPDAVYHTSSEAGIAIALAVPTFLLLIYIMVVLYRCMCTRHYAEWRSSWRNTKQSSVESRRESTGSDEYLITESLPVKLHAHSQDIEAIVSDEKVIVSSCMNGDICVWDAVSGDCLTSIKRSRLTRRRTTSHNTSKEINSSFSSDSTYSSSPASDECENYMMCVPKPPRHTRSSSYHEPVHIPKFDADQSHLNNSSKESSPSQSDGYDFSRYVKQHDSSMEDEHMLLQRPQKNAAGDCGARRLLRKRFSVEDGDEPKQTLFYSPLVFQAIWSINFCDNCVAVGCKDGRLEVWNAFNGNLEYVYEDNKSGITALSIDENKIVSARLNGFFDLFSVELSYSSIQQDELDMQQIQPQTSSIRCRWLQNVKAHSLAISALQMDCNYIVSGGYDRLVKVFRCDSAVNIYTLHGHSSPISVLHIDKYVAASAVSGCQDGLICLWDLMTGACMYSLKGHQREVMTLKLTSIYMISQGADHRICIWEKCQGHLLHSINQDYTFHCGFALLTSNIMITAKEDNLLLWDVNHGEALRMIMIGKGDHSCYIKHLQVSGQSVVCDYGPQMFMVNFPAIMDKLD